MNRTRWVDEYVVQLSDTNASSLYIIRNVNDHLISYVTSFTYINMRRKRNMDLVGSFWYNITKYYYSFRFIEEDPSWCPSHSG